MVVCEGRPVVHRMYPARVVGTSVCGLEGVP